MYLCLKLLAHLMYTVGYKTFQKTTQTKDHLYNSYFTKAIERGDFIDTTSFIRDMFQIEGNCYLSMPKDLGKTTILDMTKKFLEIEVDEHGDPTTDVENPINGTRNYKFFVENNFKVLQAEKIFKEHFGRHPVVYADFKCTGRVKTFEDFLNVCRDAIHKSFKEHKYLKDSEHLKEEEREIARKWCDDDYKALNETQITIGLRNLSDILCSHYRRKVFVLIDDDDDPVIEAFERMDDEWKAEETLEMMQAIITAVFKENSCLEQGLVVGIHSCFFSSEYKKYTPKDAMRYQKDIEILFNWRPMTISLQFIG